MPFHFCQDELLMILAMIPVIGVAFRKLHTWYHTRLHHKCHQKDCNEQHAEHTNEQRLQTAYDNWAAGFQERVETMEHLTVQTSAIDIPTPTTWDPISPEDVIERFPSLPTWIFAEDSLQWFVNDQGQLQAIRPAKVFIYDPQNGWQSK